MHERDRAAHARARRGAARRSRRGTACRSPRTARARCSVSSSAPSRCARSPTRSTSDVALFKRFFHAALARGVYLAPSPFEAGFISAAHGDAEIALTLERLDARARRGAGVASAAARRCALVAMAVVAACSTARRRVGTTTVVVERRRRPAPRAIRATRRSARCASCSPRGSRPCGSRRRRHGGCSRADGVTLLALPKPRRALDARAGGPARQRATRGLPRRYRCASRRSSCGRSIPAGRSASTAPLARRAAGQRERRRADRRQPAAHGRLRARRRAAGDRHVVAGRRGRGRGAGGDGAELRRHAARRRASRPTT